jgi:carbamate kinase
LAIPNRLLVAIGGNATHPETIEGTSDEQKAIAADTANALLPLALADNELIITHGNGPVVGKILMRQALTRERIAPCRSISAWRTARAASPIFSCKPLKTPCERPKATAMWRAS